MDLQAKVTRFILQLSLQLSLTSPSSGFKLGLHGSNFLLSTGVFTLNSTLLKSLSKLDHYKVDMAWSPRNSEQRQKEFSILLFEINNGELGGMTA